MYQDPNQRLDTIGYNRSLVDSSQGSAIQGWDAKAAEAGTPVAPGTGIALIPLASPTTKRVPSLLKAYGETNQVTQEFAWGQGNWDTGIQKP